MATSMRSAATELVPQSLAVELRQVSSARNQLAWTQCGQGGQIDDAGPSPGWMKWADGLTGGTASCPELWGQTGIRAEYRTGMSEMKRDTTTLFS